MAEQEKPLTEQESLRLITDMIRKAKKSYHDSGVGPIMWGAVIATCSLVRLAEIQFSFQLPFDIFNLTFLAIIPQVFISIREKKDKQVRSHDDVVMDYLWLSFGITILLLIHVNAGINSGLIDLQQAYEKSTGERHPFRYYEYVSSMFLILYGFPTFITGAIMKFKPMIFGGLLCWVCSIAAVYTDGRIDLLLMAISAIFAWLIPGIILQKKCNRSKKESL